MVKMVNVMRNAISAGRVPVGTISNRLIDLSKRILFVQEISTKIRYHQIAGGHLLLLLLRQDGAHSSQFVLEEFAIYVRIAATVSVEP